MGNLLTCLSSRLSTSSSSINHLDKIPIEFYHNHLFSYLDIKDLSNLKLVSKNFKKIIESYDILELSVLDDFSNASSKENWFSTTKSTKLTNLVYSSISYVPKNSSNNFLNLRHLRINFYGPINLKYLSTFIKLQILEVKAVILISPNQLLNLPYLESLSLGFLNDFFESACLTFDTFNLRNLAVYQDSSLNLINRIIAFKNPLSICSLRLSKFDKNALIFKNLECLELEYLDGLVTVDLEMFKKLNKLRIFSCHENFDDLKNIFQSKKNDLQVVLSGVKLNDVGKIEEYKQCNSYKNIHNKMFCFQMDNYNDLEDDLNFIKVLNAELVCKLFHNLPADLFSKYTNIQELRIRSNVDEDQLICFIKKCSNLSHLKVFESSISQEFYEQLPEISLLSFLQVNIKEVVDLNFEFIKRMPYLRYLITDQCLLISENLRSIGIKKIRFKLNDQLIDITKFGSDQFSVDNPKNFGLPDKKHFKLNKLIQWSKDMKHETKPRRMRKLNLNCFKNIECNLI